MQRLELKARWVLTDRRDDEVRLRQLIELLGAIHERGNLVAAGRATGLSYRHAWGILREGGQMFGVPLATLTRGQGATLTPLGEKLVWADKRVNARLHPLLDTLASELDADIQRTLDGASTILRIHASHGYAVARLRDALVASGTGVELQFRPTGEALAALARGNCELAGFHIPQGPLQEAVLTHYGRWLPSRSCRLIHVVTRRLGIMVARGNPRRIRGIADLASAGVHIVNRQAGSGTRLVLDLLLADAGIDSRQIEGYDRVEFTHDAVAAYIASGMADAGLGVETGARNLKLDFIPLLSERYYLAVHAELLTTQPVRRIVEILESAEFRAQVNDMQGLDTETAGQVLGVDEAFAAGSRASRERG